MDPPATTSPVTETPTPTPATAGPPGPPPTPTAPAPTPATTPTPVVAPAAAPQEPAPLTNDSPIEYAAEDGTARQTTMGELLAAREQLAELGDLQQIRDLQGAMANDPEAQKRLFQAQLDKLTPVPAEGVTGEAAAALLDRVSQLEQDRERSNRVIQSVEDQEFNRVLATVVKNPQVVAAYPEFAAHPDVAFHVAGKYIKQARAAANGNPVSNQSLKAALDMARGEMAWLGEKFGLTPAAAPAAAPGAAPAAAASPTSLEFGQVVKPAMVTAADLLGQTQATQAAQVAAVPQNVPAAGGAPGVGVAPAPPAPSGPISRSAFLERIKGQTRAGGAQ